MSMAEITAAAQAMRAIQQEYSGKITAINATVNAKKAEVDLFLLNAREKIAVADQAIYNPATIFSKTSLNLAADPNAPSQSIWLEMVSSTTPYIYMDYAANFGSVEFARAFANLPGFAENPNFINDRSASLIDVVFFEIGRPSQELNDRLTATGILPAFTWDTSASPRGKIVPIVPQAGRQWALCNPYIRFRNIVPQLAAQPAGTLPQPIGAFGGNTTFALQTASAHKK
jgi:hypothetical protein